MVRLSLRVMANVPPKKHKTEKEIGLRSIYAQTNANAKAMSVPVKFKLPF